MQEHLSDYQTEQLQALESVIQYLADLDALEIETLKNRLSAYLRFRAEVDQFLDTHFKDICTQSCYQSQTSACCTREGIITFFADVVINGIMSTEKDRRQLLAVLKSERPGTQCIYLGDTGCRWNVKPLVCEMFLCRKAEEAVFKNNPSLERKWSRLKQRAKQFRWPDQAVLFDDLEQIFMDAGYTSTLMYLHNTPGLQRVKERSKKKR